LRHRPHRAHRGRGTARDRVRLAHGGPDGVRLRARRAAHARHADGRPGGGRLRRDGRRRAARRDGDRTVELRAVAALRVRRHRRRLPARAPVRPGTGMIARHAIAVPLWLALVSTVPAQVRVVTALPEAAVPLLEARLEAAGVAAEIERRPTSVLWAQAQAGDVAADLLAGVDAEV